jgi:hypothetical protein
VNICCSPCSCRSLQLIYGIHELAVGHQEVVTLFPLALLGLA